MTSVNQLAAVGSIRQTRVTTPHRVSSYIEAAIALGCRVLISETLSILKNSLSNLEKAGFRTIFEKEVYEANIGA
jgi:hypothetical protein